MLQSPPDLRSARLSGRPQRIVSGSSVLVCGFDCGLGHLARLCFSGPDCVVILCDIVVCESIREYIKMTASVQQKKLTTPPKDLKEAIDWLIQIKNDDVIKDLAEALEKLLKHDGSEVAMKVLEKYRLASKSVIEKLTPQKLKRHFAVPHAILNKLSEGLRPFHPQSQANINSAGVEKVGEWALKVESNLKRLITGLAGGLECFKKDILQNSDTSTYSKAAWNTLTTIEKRDCAAILLGVMPVVYIGLTYLYWQCEGQEGWDKESLSEDKDLRKFLVAFGYAEKDLNDSKRGQEIATELQSAFSKELQKHKSTAASQDYPDFLKALQDQAVQPTPDSSCPLTSLYLLSYYYITNFLYIVEPTSTATPSFLGYSGTAALAGGAYGFNLGGMGTFMSALLA
ncbi:uncharacterized protein BcabD6B2_53760 [Babesia caballi]|uniref:Uncharacterized protein n=1 Tax=Babesia caballi TaxID=5871 RepID=A0AAV4LZU7_BABCB|nr:hypothetical protein, conserved [Babesia caballi]GIX65941.1 hypothetical protein, conserved [Babesia caballi]